ncbi:unnamed protein product [Lactuca saligna]|uniref:DUF4378 domain-containing protein n=1 Tax=Lactuca saligna TaxID=75948 RepID=A0AA35YHB1_LACSI|nr:unnamed protein product [Lactuca saligna]
MGKHWLLCKVPDGDYNATTKHSSSSTTNTKSAGKSRKRGGVRPTSSSSSSSSSSASGGCMSAIFHLFDIQHHHFPFRQPSLIISDSSINIPQEPNFILKGVEAPRNSLELEEQEPNVQEAAPSSSSLSKVKQETDFIIPVGGIQIKTKRSRLMDEVSSECSSSPGSKTPSLVARLMGLDLLPENSSPRTSLSSPRPSSSSSHATPSNPLSKLSSHKISTRSLPATPRISTAARPSTEVDYHHRLSLQTTKENRRKYGESTTSEYAKQIAQQVRENISRRVGADITNTMKRKEHRRDECLVVLKPKRQSPPPSAINYFDDQGHVRAKENEPVPLSCSSRLKSLEIKNNFNKPISNSAKTSPLSSSTEVMKSPSSLSSSRSPPLIKEELHVVKQENPVMKVQKCKRIASEKYDLRLKKVHQQEEPFTKKCNKKSTPLSNHLVNVNTTTKFISFKKDIDMASPSSTTLSQKQVPLESITQLPSCQSRSYKETHELWFQDNVSSNGNGVAAITTTTTGGRSVSDHLEYISRILSHAGIEKTTPISVTHWYSPSHPLHPSIFHQLEKLINPTVTTNFITRKLIFDVADELLVEILKPYISFKPWAAGRNSYKMYGSELIGKLCEKVTCFPAADCRVLEDIDAVIEGDMRSCTKVVGEIAFEEEAEELVAEMERDMVDTLVNEMAGIIWHVGCGGRI